MEGFSATFSPALNEALIKDIMKEELGHAVTSMAKGKRRDTTASQSNFFKKLWHFIGKDFYLMILNDIRDEKLHEGVTKCLICPIPKEGDSKDLNYWRPITLLPVTYTFFAKVLQTRLQPILRDVISPEQTIFLPLMFIIYNIVLN